MNSNIEKIIKNNPNLSPYFNYKVSRNILQWTGDTGGFNSTGCGAHRLFGSLPEEYGTYLTDKADPTAFDREPSAFSYFIAQNFKSRHLRLDKSGMSKEQLLITFKQYISSKSAVNFTFKVFKSMSQASENGRVPYPCNNENFCGNHSILAIGYHDNLIIKNKNCDIETMGAFLIRNSWGIEWGDDGNGWLPYDYVLNSLVNDCWIILDKKNIDITQFQP